MSIVKLAELFSAMLGYKVYAINFPEFKDKDFKAKIEITSGVSSSGGVNDFNVQFMTKAEHPAEAERVALDIIQNLDMKTNKLFDEDKYQLILMKANSTEAYYVGVTETGQYIFSCDFRLLTTKI